MKMRLSRVPDLSPLWIAATASLFGLAIATAAHAAGSGMPWEEPLQQVLESVQGPVAKIVAVIILIATGLGEVYLWTVRFQHRKEDKHKPGEPGLQPDGSR